MSEDLITDYGPLGGQIAASAINYILYAMMTEWLAVTRQKLRVRSTYLPTYIEKRTILYKVLSLNEHFLYMANDKMNECVGEDTLFVL